MKLKNVDHASRKIRTEAKHLLPALTWNGLTECPFISI